MIGPALGNGCNAQQVVFADPAGRADFRNNKTPVRYRSGLSEGKEPAFGKALGNRTVTKLNAGFCRAEQRAEMRQHGSKTESSHRRERQEKQGLIQPLLRVPPVDQCQKQRDQRSQHQQAESAEQSRCQQAPSFALFRVCLLHLALQRRLGFVQGVRCRLAVQQTVALCLEKQDPQGRDQHSGGVFLQKESQHRRENQNGFFRRNPLSADLGQGLQNQRSTGKQRCRKTGGHPQTAQRRDQP